MRFPVFPDHTDLTGWQPVFDMGRPLGHLDDFSEVPDPLEIPAIKMPEVLLLPIREGVELVHHGVYPVRMAQAIETLLHGLLHVLKNVTPLHGIARFADGAGYLS